VVRSAWGMRSGIKQRKYRMHRISSIGWCGGVSAHLARGVSLRNTRRGGLATLKQSWRCV